MLSFNSQSFQLFNVFRSLSLFISVSFSLSSFSLYISKFPFYIQRHYRKAFNSSHNVLCIWILKEEMETFFAAACGCLLPTCPRSSILPTTALETGLLGRPSIRSAAKAQERALRRARFLQRVHPGLSWTVEQTTHVHPPFAA